MSSKIEVNAQEVMPFHISLLGYFQGGPEATELGKSRHDHALRLICERVPKPTGDVFKIVYFVAIGGSLTLHPIPFGMFRCRVYAKRDVAYIDVGIPTEMLHWNEEVYREAFASFVLDGGRTVSQRIRKRGLTVDADAVFARVEEIVKEYLALPLPLKPIPREAEQIRETREMIRAFEEGGPLPLGDFDEATFFVYFGKSVDASDFKRMLSERGYKCRLEPRRGTWLCKAVKRLDNPEDLQCETERLDRLARQSGGELDGWEVGMQGHST